MNKQAIKKMIREAGLSEDLFFVGTGVTYYSNGKTFRYVFNASSSNYIDTQIYAIKYYSSLDRFFVWERAHRIPAERNRIINRRMVFSIKRETIEALGQKMVATKKVEFHGDDYPEEIVLVLTKDGLEEWLHDLASQM